MNDMSQTTVNLGYVPKNRGEYSSIASYYKDNIVQYNGSSYICNPPNYDPDTAPTASITGVAPYTSDPAVPNTGWAVFSNDSSGVGEGVYDVSVDHTTDNKPKIYASLSAALNDIPAAKKKGGMEIKFISNNSNYAVDKEEGITTQPAGTLITSSPTMVDGTYKASQLLTYFSTLPTATGAGNAVIYYKEVDGTYTAWTITLQSSDNKYVQYRLMADTFNTTVANWQGVEVIPTLGSRNMPESGGVASAIRRLKGAEYVLDSDFDNWCYRTNPEIGQPADITNKYSVGGDWYSKIVPCNQGDKFLLTGKGGNLTRLWMFLDSSTNNVISKSDSYASATELELTCPQNNALLVINIDYEAVVYGRNLTVVGDILDINKKIVEIDNEIEDINENIDGLQENLTDTTIELVLGAYRNNNVGIGNTYDSSSVWENSNWRCAKVECNKGDMFRVIGTGSNNNRLWSFVRKSDNVLLKQETGIIPLDKYIVCPEDSCYLLYNNYIPECAIYSLTNICKQKTIDKREGRVDDLLLIPQPDIYCRYFNIDSAYPRMNNAVYAEGFIKDGSIEATIDGGKEHSIFINRNNNQKETVSIGYGNNKQDVVIKEKVVNPSSSAIAGKKAFVLCFGESTTAAHQKDPRTGGYTGGWGWPSSMREFSIRDRSYNVGADVVTLGHGHNGYDDTIESNGNTYTVHSNCFGFGGNPLYAFLYWPCRAKVQNITDLSRFAPETMWYGAGLYSKTLYNASSYNINTEEYTGSPEQITLLTQTPVGKYKIDGSEKLWNLIKSLGTTYVSDGYPAFTETGSYSGTTAQIEAMQSWMDALCNNPINKFYSLDEVRTGSSGTAFSLAKYLERYRTLDNAGNRLVGNAGETVVGGDGNTYTIGTLITSTNECDVCTPTHVIINIGINDAEGLNTYSNLVENVKTVVNQFTMKVAYFVCRIPGANCIGAWGDDYIPKKYEPFTVNSNALFYLRDWFESQANKYLLPIYLIQPPCSQMNEFYEDDFVSGNKKLNCGQNDVHPGYFAYKAIGLQCLHWVYFTLT